MKNEEIGKRIQERRKALKISAAEVADGTGLSKATIHRYENGEIRNIKLPVIEAIASMLNVNALWLIGKSDDMKRTDGKSTDLIMCLDQSIDFVKGTRLLMVRKRKVTERERRIIIKSMQLMKDILDKGD